LKTVKTANTKKAAASRKWAKAERKPKKEKRERIWGDPSSDEEHVDETIPQYLIDRRKGLDYERMGEAGLRLPPIYDDMEAELLHGKGLEDLEERPQLPRLEPSRKYEDIQLRSLGLIPGSIAQYLRLMEWNFSMNSLYTRKADC